MDNQLGDTAASPAPAAQATADGFITYASFSADGTRGSKAGWRVGQRVRVNDQQATELIAKAPIHLATEASVPRYVDDAARRDLIRRAVWTTVPEGGTTHVFAHSTPAGTDASGRPSNVFSTMYVFDAATRMGAYPVQFLGSPSVLVPFNAEVNHLEVAGADLELNRGLTPRHAFERLMSSTRRGFNAIRDMVLTMLDLLVTGTPVIIADDPKNAPHWLVLLTMATDSLNARAITFSTYERGAALKKAGGSVYQVSVVPAGDYQQLVDEHLGGAVVFDMTRGVSRGRWRETPTRYADSDGAEVEVSAVAELYAFVASSPTSADRLLQEPVVGGSFAEKLALLALDDPDAAFDAVAGPLDEVRRDSPSEGDLAQKISALHSGRPTPRPRQAEDNPFAASTPVDSPTPAEPPAPAEALDEPEIPAGLLPAAVRRVSEKQLANDQYLLETAKWDFARRKRMPWYAMTEFLLMVAPDDSALGTAQTHLFAAAAVDVVRSPQSPGDEVAVLPFWRLFLPESTTMLQSVLRLAVAHIDQLSAGKGKPRSDFHQEALRRSQHYRQTQGKNHRDFAVFLDKFAAELAPPARGRTGQAAPAGGQSGQDGRWQWTAPQKHTPYQHPPQRPPRF